MDRSETARQPLHHVYINVAKGRYRCGIWNLGFHLHASFPSGGRSASVPSTGCHRRCVHADDAQGPSGLRMSEERADFGVVCEAFLDGTS